MNGVAANAVSSVRGWGPRSRPSAVGALHLSAEQLVHLLRQVCAALQDAHGNGLVHRDIKPANVVVSRAGTTFDFVKVLDFGLVKLDSAGRFGPDAVNLSAEDSWSGTPGYIAPEVVLGSGCAPLRLQFQGGWNHMVAGWNRAESGPAIFTLVGREPTLWEQRTSILRSRVGGNGRGGEGWGNKLAGIDLDFGRSSSLGWVRA
jgi:serine/threonine protein kinase